MRLGPWLEWWRFRRGEEPTNVDQMEPGHVGEVTVPSLISMQLTLTPVTDPRTGSQGFAAGV
jgi:hypothetical protein